MASLCLIIRMALINWWDGLHSVVLIFFALCLLLLSWTECRLSSLPCARTFLLIVTYARMHALAVVVFFALCILKNRLCRLCLPFVLHFLSLRHTHPCLRTRAHTCTHTHTHTHTHNAHTHTYDVRCLVGSHGIKFCRHSHCEVF